MELNARYSCKEKDYGSLCINKFNKELCGESQICTKFVAIHFMCFCLQSSESFFPDKSITLGSLIGIQSRTQPHQTHAIMLQRADRARKKAGIISNVGGGGTAMSGTIRGDRTCCSLLVCGSGVDRHKQVGMSPSLAHFLDMERKKKCTKRPSTTNKEKHTDEHIVHNMGVVSTRESVACGDTLFDHEGI